MNKFTKIFFCIASVCIILVSMCPISAFAAPDVFYMMPFDKPTVTEYSGYVELLFRDKYSGDEFVRVVSWFFTPISISSDTAFTDKPQFHIVRNASQFRIGIESGPGVYGNVAFIDSVADNIILWNYSVPDNDSVFYYNVNYGSDYTLVGMHYYGDFVSVSTDSALSDKEFYVTYSEDAVISYGLSEIISGLYSLIDLTDSEAYKSQLDSILSSLNSFEGTFEEFEEYYKSKMTILLSYMEDYFQQLKTLISNSEVTNQHLKDISGLLSSYLSSIYGLIDWLSMIELDSNVKLYEIKDTLDAILAILQANSDVTFTDRDTSNLNNYYDAENSLLNDDNVDVSGSVNVDINPNAMSAIWNLIDRFLNVNPKVIGAVITILSLGLIALILGR